MYEYEVDVVVEDKNKIQHIIKRYYVMKIMGRYQLKEILDKMLKKDKEISQYKIISYDVLNWDEVAL